MKAICTVKGSTLEQTVDGTAVAMTVTVWEQASTSPQYLDTYFDVIQK
jgi:hypothetical protein